jgi:hypothetical protein
MYVLKQGKQWHFNYLLCCKFFNVFFTIILSYITSDCHFHWLAILFRSKLQIKAVTGYLLRETTYSIDTWSFFLRNAVRTDASEDRARATYCPASMWCSAKASNILIQSTFWWLSIDRWSYPSKQKFLISHTHTHERAREYIYIYILKRTH